MLTADMEQAATPPPGLEGALPNADLDQSHHLHYGPAQYGRDTYSTDRQLPYSSAGYANREAFPPSFVERGPYTHEGYTREGILKDGEVTSRAGTLSESMQRDDPATKKQKRADWWHESQGAEQRPQEVSKDLSCSGSNHGASPTVPMFGSPIVSLRGMGGEAQSVGVEGQAVSMEEGDAGGSSGGGAGVGDDEEGADGEGKERLDKEGSAKKKRAEMWQDGEMDALVRAYREVHMKLAAAGKKGKQVFKSATDKWKEVHTLLLAVGVDRQPKEIERKWSNLSTAFKQIADWNKKVGRPNYWDLDDSLKKEKTKAKELPATFRVQLFDAMAEFMGDRHGTHRSRSPAPSHLAVPGLPRGVPSPGVVEVSLPMEKLTIHSSPLDAANQKRMRVVLVSTGSFNPPTYMHLRLFELARDALTTEGYDVLGSYMSPVSDFYNKKGLAPAEHRIKLCQLAVSDSSFVMVDPWEAQQNTYQRTLMVLGRIESAINSHGFSGEEKVRVMLLCGADLLESMTKAGVWIPEQVRALLREHGVVCINREGKDVRQLMFEHDILFNNRRQILVVDEPIHNDISSTKIRRNFSRGLSVKYLTTDSVINYMKVHELYMNVPPRLAEP